ncbi:MAG: hemolysin III family protein [Blastocatellia bacterium]
MHIERRLVVEELANTITHGIGLILSIVALAILSEQAWQKPETRYWIGCVVYGLTQAILYAASTAYHAVHKPGLKHLFRQVDQVAIYLMIAGTYTPFMLINLRGFWGNLVLAIVWALAVFGIAFKLIFANRYKSVTMALYLAIGWAAIIAVKPIFEKIPLSGMAWVGAGGLAYMLGLIFFAWERLPFHHVIWHLFVLAGSGCFFVAILRYVLPA